MYGGEVLARGDALLPFTGPAGLQASSTSHIIDTSMVSRWGWALCWMVHCPAGAKLLMTACWTSVQLKSITHPWGPLW